MITLNIDQLDSGTGWVLVFPRGKHFINKYELVLNCDDKFFNSIKEWWDKSTFIKPFLDKNHEFDERFGDFTEMRVTDKGLELFLVLNDTGKELVKSKKYMYLSPTFVDAADSTGKKYKNVIYTVSLVNSPALMTLNKLQDQIALSIQGEENNKPKGGSLMELNQRIAGMLKLNLASDDMSILAKIEELINSGATIEDLKTQIADMKTALDKAELKASDMEKKATDAECKLAAIQVESARKEAEIVIDEAIKCGQYHPSLKDDKLELFLKNPEMIKKELSVIPKVEGKGLQLSVVTGDTVTFSEEDKAILLSAGYNLEDPKDLSLAKEFVKNFGGK